MLTLTSEVRRGRWILAIILIACFLLEVSLAPADRMSSIPVVVTALLFYAIWKGHVWAKLVVSVLFAVAFVAVLSVVVQHPNWFTVILSIQLGASFAALTISPSVAAFLKYQDLKGMPTSE